MKGQSYLSVIWSLLLLMVGCTVGNVEVVTPIGPTVHPTIQVTRTTPTPDQPVSPIPSDTPLPAQTPILAVTVPPTETMIPHPSLSSEEPLEAVRALFENNGGCRLPCWWGFIPGETEWTKARSYLTPLVSVIYLIGSPNDPIYYFDVSVPVPTDIYPDNLSQRYTVQEGIIEMIEVHIGNTSNYYLHHFLDTYGPPSEVWISTYREPREADLPFSTVLFYRGQSMMIEYGIGADKEGDEVVACLNYYLSANLVVWPPNDHLTFEQATSNTIQSGIFAQQGYIELNEAAGIDASSFYEIFSDTDNQECIRTPAALWPSP